MTRFIDQNSHNELIPGIHDVTKGKAFPDDHFLFQPIPDGMEVLWENGMPTLRAATATIKEVEDTIRIEREEIINHIYVPAIQQIGRWIDESEDNPAALAHYKAQRSSWHAWADALCDLPDQPGWPWPEGDVPWPEQPPKPMRYTP